MKKFIGLIIGLALLLGVAGAINYYVQPDTALQTNQTPSESVIDQTTVEVETTIVETTIAESEANEETDGSQDAEENTEADQVEDVAIDFPNLEMRDAFGNIVQLHDLIDKPAIINFWASWCPPCIEEMPYFQSQYDQHKDEIDFIMLNATGSRPTETIEAANQFLREQNLQLPVYFDPDLKSQIQLGIVTLPTTYVINRRGESERIVGMLTDSQLNEIVETLLAE